MVLRSFNFWPISSAMFFCICVIPDLSASVLLTTLSLPYLSAWASSSLDLILSFCISKLDASNNNFLPCSVFAPPDLSAWLLNFCIFASVSRTAQVSISLLAYWGGPAKADLPISSLFLFSASLSWSWAITFIDLVPSDWSILNLSIPSTVCWLIFAIWVKTSFDLSDESKVCFITFSREDISAPPLNTALAWFKILDFCSVEVSFGIIFIRSSTASEINCVPFLSVSNLSSLICKSAALFVVAVSVSLPDWLSKFNLFFSMSKLAPADAKFL